MQAFTLVGHLDRSYAALCDVPSGRTAVSLDIWAFEAHGVHAKMSEILAKCHRQRSVVCCHIGGCRRAVEDEEACWNTAGEAMILWIL